MLSIADRMGLVVMLACSRTPRQPGEQGMNSQTRDEPVVIPLTKGNVIRYPGIAPTLVGRWSPDNCAQNYVVFTEAGYVVTRDRKTSSETVAITETLEDDFQLYLRRSPTLVEHLQKLSPNDIQMSGSTCTGGFMQSGNTIQILTRCPRASVRLSKRAKIANLGREEKVETLLARFRRRVRSTQDHLPGHCQYGVRPV